MQLLTPCVCWQAYYTAVVTAQTPAMVCNIIIASLIAMGMGNLNHSAAAIVLTALLLAIGALASMQMLMFCTLAAPNSDVVSVIPAFTWCTCCTL